MKLSNLSKALSTGVIAASLSVVTFTLSAQAQDTAPGTYVEPNGAVETAYQEEDNSNWGWLGLLGLIGLAGLIPKKRHESVHYIDSEPNVVARSGSDYRR